MGNYDKKFDDFIAWAKLKMDQMGLRHEDVARYGCSRTLVTTTLGKRHNPGEKFFVALAGALGISLDEVYARAGLKNDYQAGINSAEPITRKLAKLPDDKRAMVGKFVDFLAQDETAPDDKPEQKPTTQDLADRAEILTEDARRKMIDAADILKRRQKPDNPSNNQVQPDQAKSQLHLL